MDRRKFVWSAGAVVAGVPARGWARVADEAMVLRVDEAQVLAQVPLDFVGLSYESQQLSDPTFFSAANKALIPFFRTLSAHGVLRLGGNTSANSWWKPTASSVKPEFSHVRHVVEDGVPSDKLAYAITPESIVNLKAFLDATGWRAIYGLNLANGTPEAAAEEAAFVAKTLGAKLLYFQVGNEVDLFDRSVRPKGWTVDEYFAEWLRFARAITERVPAAQFSAPDVSGKMSWVSRFAELLKATENAPKVAAITHHYYVGGPPSDPKLTREKMLGVDPRVAHDAEIVTAAAKELGARVRLTESNTSYHGGKPGVSDVFASTLWAGEYALMLARDGYAGLNLHGGGGKQVADSLGGRLPGEALLPPGSEWHPSPFYTPIADAEKGGYAAEPVYYGLLLADYFAGCAIVRVDLAGAPAGVHVFAARGESESARLGKIMRVAVINTTSTDLRVSLPVKDAKLERVTASGLDAKDVRFGGEEVLTSGKLREGHLEKVKGSEIVVRRESAVLVGWL